MAFVMRQAFELCSQYDRETRQDDREAGGIALATLNALASELEKSVSVIVNAGQIETIAETTAEQNDYLSAAAAHLTYLAVLGAAVMMMMPNLDRAAIPKRAEVH